MVDGDHDSQRTERGSAMKDQAFDKTLSKMSGSAHRASGPAFGDVAASAGPEVSGHVLSSDALDPASDVEGHAMSLENEAAAAAAPRDDGPEVEGHMNPILMTDYARGRSADFQAEAARMSKAHEARSGRDGGIVDKVLRRKSK